MISEIIIRGRKMLKKELGSLTKNCMCTNTENCSMMMVVSTIIIYNYHVLNNLYMRNSVLNAYHYFI